MNGQDRSGQERGASRFDRFVDFVIRLGDFILAVAAIGGAIWAAIHVLPLLLSLALAVLASLGL